jgi:hypothetical protein
MVIEMAPLSFAAWGSEVVARAVRVVWDLSEVDDLRRWIFARVFGYSVIGLFPKGLVDVRLDCFGIV